MSWKTLGIYLIIISLNGCAIAQDTFPEKKFLIVSEAKDVTEYRGFKGKRLQINFANHLDYPALSIGAAQWKKLDQHGWSKCSSGKLGWVSYVDATQETHRKIFQHTTYWTKNHQLLTVSLRYESSVRRDKPDNNKQHALIILDGYDDLNVFETVKNHLQISCK